MPTDPSDTEATTNASILARNTALQADHDALVAAQNTFNTARNTYLAAMRTAENAVPATMKSGSSNRPAD